LEALRRRAYELAESPEAEPAELEAIVRALNDGEEERPKTRRRALERERFEQRATQTCQEGQWELAIYGEENPLDDQDKLDEVRRLVFGSAPE